MSFELSWNHFNKVVVSTYSIVHLQCNNGLCHILMLFLWKRLHFNTMYILDNKFSITFNVVIANQSNLWGTSCTSSDSCLKLDRTQVVGTSESNCIKWDFKSITLLRYIHERMDCVNTHTSLSGVAARTFYFLIGCKCPIE